MGMYKVCKKEKKAKNSSEQILLNAKVCILVRFFIRVFLHPANRGSLRCSKLKRADTENIIISAWILAIFGIKSVEWTGKSICKVQIDARWKIDIVRFHTFYVEHLQTTHLRAHLDPCFVHFPFVKEINFHLSSLVRRQFFGHLNTVDIIKIKTTNAIIWIIFGWTTPEKSTPHFSETFEIFKIQNA